MFSKSIIQSDEFLSMGSGAQMLYMHLALVADDDGFVSNPKSIMKMLGTAEDEMRVLIARRYVLAFETGTGVIVIRHWRMHNYLRSDRYKETDHTAEKSMLSIDSKGRYDRKEDQSGIPSGNQVATIGIPTGNPGKVRLVKGRTPLPPTGELGERWADFWAAYPRRDAKAPARKSFEKISPDEDLFGVMMAGLEKQKQSEQWTRDGGKFIPYAATWLNQKRWEDDDAEPAEVVKEVRFL
jgi:hypothetical protein